MDTALVLVGFAGLIALVVKLIDFAKMLSALFQGDTTQRSSIVTQVLVWIVAVLAVLVYASSDLGSTVNLTDALTLDAANIWTRIMVGIMLGSAGSTLIDFKQAVDHTDSAVKPPLIGAPAAPPPSP